jgi:hypothetical protein
MVVQVETLTVPPLKDYEPCRTWKYKTQRTNTLAYYRHSSYEKNFYNINTFCQWHTTILLMTATHKY